MNITETEKEYEDMPLTDKIGQHRHSLISRIIRNKRKSCQRRSNRRGYRNNQPTMKIVGWLN